jgi:hypothetical protein
MCLNVIDVAESNFLQHFVRRDACLELVVAGFQIALQPEQPRHDDEQFRLDRHAATVELQRDAAQAAVWFDGDIELRGGQIEWAGGPVIAACDGGCGQHNDD